MSETSKEMEVTSESQAEAVEALSTWLTSQKIIFDQVMLLLQSLIDIVIEVKDMMAQLNLKAAQLAMTEDPEAAPGVEDPVDIKKMQVTMSSPRQTRKRKAAAAAQLVAPVPDEEEKKEISTGKLIENFK